MTGFVWLVGAGPGDPDLLTVRAARLVTEADVVVHDALVGDGVMKLVPSGTEVIDVGKRPGSGVPQEETNALLVALARSGRKVVRLKGGDPFVFGRGGEEVLACVEGRVPVEVVPGVTSAIAAPAAVGIPLTHRATARSFAVVTGSTAHAEDTVDLARMATATDTLVVLMAAGALARTCATLVGAGRPPGTPAAVVQWAWTHEQRAVVGTLADLPTLAAAANIGPPATLVVGDVVSIAPMGVERAIVGYLPDTERPAPVASGTIDGEDPHDEPYDRARERPRRPGA